MHLQMFIHKKMNYNAGYTSPGELRMQQNELGEKCNSIYYNCSFSKSLAGTMETQLVKETPKFTFKETLDFIGVTIQKCKLDSGNTNQLKKSLYFCIRECVFFAFTKNYSFNLFNTWRACCCGHKEV